MDININTDHHKQGYLLWTFNFIIVYCMEEKMSEKEKLTLLEETFELDEGSLKSDMVLSEIEGYDSMAKLSLIVMLEDECNKTVSGEQIRALRTVADILNLM